MKTLLILASKFVDLYEWYEPSANDPFQNGNNWATVPGSNN